MYSQTFLSLSTYNTPEKKLQNIKGMKYKWTYRHELSLIIIVFMY